MTDLSNRPTTRRAKTEPTPRATRPVNSRDVVRSQKPDTTVLGGGNGTEDQGALLRRLSCELGLSFLFTPTVPAREADAPVGQLFDSGPDRADVTVPFCS